MSVSEEVRSRCHVKHQVSHSASAENIAADNFAVDVHLRMMTLGNHAANAANNHSHYLQQAAAQHNNAIRLVLFPIFSAGLKNRF